jgi:hypothetical protein
MARKFRRQPLEHRLAGFLDLQEEWSAIAANVQPNGAERANATDANHLEGDILQPISVEETKPVGLQAALISVKSAPGIEVVTGVPWP